MENLPLPSELERLERLLAFGPLPEPSAALRRRVLGGVRWELRSPQDLPGRRFAVAFAAMLLVGLSLSLSALQATLFAMPQRAVSPSIDEVAWRLQQISPRLSREESLRQAVLRHIGAAGSCQTALGDILSEHECHDPR